MVAFLIVVIVAIALGLVGAVVHGLTFLLAIACLLFIADVAYVGARSARRRRPVR